MKRILCIRHTVRDLDTKLPNDEGIALAKRVITPLGPFDLVVSANAKHCFGTATSIGIDGDEVIIDYTELEAFVPYQDELKHRARAAGRDHSALWFEELGQAAVDQIKEPGESYLRGIKRLVTSHEFETALVILRGSGLEGLACFLDLQYKPLGGWHFDRCEGFWVTPDEQGLALSSYVRRR